MKHKLLLTLGTGMLLFSQIAFAQSDKTFNAGSVNDFLSKVKNNRHKKSAVKDAYFEIPLAEGKSLKCKPDHWSAIGTDSIIAGTVENEEKTSFYFEYSNKSIKGKVISDASEKVYEYFSKNGKVSVKKGNIHNEICIGYGKKETEAPVKFKEVTGTTAAVTIPVLESLPGATAVAYLDFDGEIVNNTLWNRYDGNTINAAPPSFSTEQIYKIWERVSEDFRPFNINITTDLNKYIAAPENRRMKCVFSPTNYFTEHKWAVAYMNSFTQTEYSKPCWVFDAVFPNCANAASHEIAHTLGLSHDAIKDNMDGIAQEEEAYYRGHADWAPIMGVGHGKNAIQWSKGEYANASNFEDDLAIIANATNGFGYRGDEDANTIATARNLAINGTTIAASSNTGIITTRTDVDYFKFTLQYQTKVTLTVSPFATKQNLDIAASILSSSGNHMYSSNPAGIVSPATFSVVLNAGTYYIAIDGSGYADPLSTGYSDYASLGTYSISGNLCIIPNAPNIVGSTSLCVNPPNNTYSIIGNNTDTYSTYYSWSLSSGSLGGFTSSYYGYNVTGATVDFNNSITGKHYVQVTASNSCGTGPTAYLQISIDASVFSTPPTPQGPSTGYNSGCVAYYSMGGMMDGVVYEVLPASAVASSSSSMYGQLNVDWANNYVGQVTIRAKRSNGCGSSGWSGYKYVNIVSGTACKMGVTDNDAELVSNEWFAEVYPNPSGDEANLRINSSLGEQAVVSIYDMQGTLVYKNEATATGADLSFGTELSSGVYAIKISTGGIEKTLKFVKQ